VSKVTDFEPTQDNVAALFGPRIGQGAYRDVYQYDADKVVKYDRSIAHGYSRANKTEWDIWDSLKDTPCAQYLCPILERSSDDDCALVVQPKVTPLTTVERTLRDDYESDKVDYQSYRDRTVKLSMQTRAFTQTVKDLFPHMVGVQRICMKVT
jgi:hypothetical protein